MKITLSSLAIVVALSLSACGGGSAHGGGGGNTPPPNNGGGGGSSGGSAQAAGVFLINNQSSQTICYAMISPSSDPNWGPDQLGSNTIASGSTYAWQAGSGVWDVQLQDCNHSTLLERRGLDIQGAGTELTVTD